MSVLELFVTSVGSVTNLESPNEFMKLDHSLFIFKVSKYLLKSLSIIISLFSGKICSPRTSNLSNNSALIRSASVKRAY